MNPRRSLLRYLILALGVFLTPNLVAETRYVTDQTSIPLRAGEGLNYKVLRNLPTGTPLEILSHNQKSGYAKVRTHDGKLGFVANDQLLGEPVARDQIATLEAKVAQFQARFDALPPSLQEAQSKLDAALTNKQRLEEELLSIRQAAGDAPRILRERGELRQTVADLTRKVAELEQLNREQDHQTAQRWFLIGGGVTVGGILIGIFLPNLRLGRKRGFQSRL